MPFARYFYLVGGVLLALLFILDASFPKLPVAAKAKVYPPVIRIYSDRKSPERVIADFKTFVEKVRAKLPDTEIDYISIAGNPARWAQVDKIKAVNSAIEAWIKEQPKMKFINVFAAMLGPDGLPKPDIFVADKLHMNAAGYAIWKELLGPFLLK